MFAESLWPGLMTCCILYLSDYLLTVACARKYRAQSTIVFEGSFEITPAYQKDIDSLRLLSPRFLFVLVSVATLLWALWRLTHRPAGDPRLYLFCLGALVLLQLAIHVRHLGNWYMFTHAIPSEGIRGHLEYSRSSLLRASAWQLAAFSGLFLVLSVATSSWLALGGAVSCLLIALKHLRYATKAVAQAASKN